MKIGLCTFSVRKYSFKRCTQKKHVNLVSRNKENQVIFLRFALKFWIWGAAWRGSFHFLV